MASSSKLLDTLLEAGIEIAEGLHDRIVEADALASPGAAQQLAASANALSLLAQTLSALLQLGGADEGN